ncbi:hypothetical protein D9M68_637720 [compost metagenome]
MLNLSGPLNQYLEIFDVRINGKKEVNVDFFPNDNIDIEIQYKIKEDLNNVIIIISLFNEGYRLFTKRNTSDQKAQAGQIYKVKFQIKKFTLRPATYSLAIGGWANNETLWTWGLDILDFKIEEIWSDHFNKADEGIMNLDIITERFLL